MIFFNFGQKYVIAYPHSYPKSPKPSPNSKNSNFGAKKRVGWAINSGTHFTSADRTHAEVGYGRYEVRDGPEVRLS